MKILLSFILLFFFFLTPLNSIYNQLPVWIEGEYLFWKIKKLPLPIPLITQGSFNDSIVGAIGKSGTKIKLGKQNVDMGLMNGIQVTSGVWLSEGKKIGFKISYFNLFPTKRINSLDTSGELQSPSYAVPIYDVTGLWGLEGVPGESIYLLPGPLDALPGFNGNFNLILSNQFQSAQLNCIYQLAKSHLFQFYSISGFRWVQLKEQLTFQISTHSVPDFPFGFTFANIEDNFTTKNNFYFLQIGIRPEYLMRYFDLKGSVQIGLGTIFEKIQIQGYSSTSNGNLFYETKNTDNITLNGGIFAQKTNIGSYYSNLFAAIVDTNIQASLKLFRNFQFEVGYSFLWVSKIARPSKQIDRNINPTLTALADASRATVGTQQAPTSFAIPGPAQPSQGSMRPNFALKNSDFWIQGISVGMIANF